MTQAHVLVIGGSGMLAGLCEHLAREGDRVSVVGRDSVKLQHVADRVPGHIVPLSLDYRKERAFCDALSVRAEAYGRPRRTVCWAHEDAPDVPLKAAGLVDGVFWHVLSSAHADPARPDRLAAWRSRFDALPAIDYRQVILGFVTDGRGSRWLTNEEISEGVWQAICNGQALSIAGTVSPWSMRPAR